MEAARVARVVQNVASDVPSVLRVVRIIVLDEQSVVRVAQNAASEAPSLAKVD